MYEFVTIGGGEYFVDIFTGVASIVKSDDYMVIVKIAASMAFFMALLNAALSNSLYNAGKWFLTTFVVMQVLLFPKVSLHVTDKTNPVIQGATIDNVPFVVAYAASTSSRVGYSLTKLFETVFSLPDDLQYSENGMLFGVNLFKAISQARIHDANLSASVDSFTKNCIFYDLELGIYSFNDLKQSQDIWQFVKSSKVENRFFTYHAQNGSVSYPSCKDGVSSLDADFKNELQNPANIAFYAKKPDLSNILLSSASTDVNEYFLNISKTAEQSLQQAMMINAIDNATQNYEAENKIELYQNTKATMQAKSTYQAMGAQAGIWIPILKIVIESIFIASFPLIILLSFIPNFTGTVLKGYFGTFFWLAAWGPIYAILHRITMGHAKTYTLDFGGLTLYSQPGIETAMNDISAMAGYMSMFVPMLAFGIARGGAAAMSSMTTSFMSGVQGAVSTAVHETTTGNMSFGNVGVGSRAISSGVSMMNDAGQVGRHHEDGSFSIDNSAVESRFGSFDLRGSERIESALSNSISNEQSLAQSKTMQSQTLEAQGLEKAITNHRAIESSRGFEQNATADERQAFHRVSSAVDEFAKSHNITQGAAAEAFAKVGASGGLKIAGIRASAEAGVAKRAYHHDDKLHQEVDRFTKDRNLSHDFEVMKTSLQSNRFNATDSNGESINKTFSKASHLSEEASAHFDQAKRFSEQQQYVQSHSLEFDQSYNNEFVQHIRNKYGSNDAVFEITNPNNSDHSARNGEISEFNSLKTQEIIKNIPSKGGFESQYNDARSNIKSSSSSVGNYGFSSGMKEIDNSNLPRSVNNQFDNVTSDIENVKLGSSASDEVKKKQ